MNTLTLNKYGISFYKQSKDYFKIVATSPNLAIYLDKFTKYKPELESFLNAIDLALSNNYDSIDYDDREWHKELGMNLYTGIIQNDKTFDLFIENHYDETLETFPLSDIKEVFSSLLEFIG